MNQLHTYTHKKKTSAHMHVPSHTLTLAFKHTEPCKVLLSAEERSLAFFAVSLSRANVQQRLSLASSPMRQTDAQRGREGRARDADGQRTGRKDWFEKSICKPYYEKNYTFVAASERPDL